MAPEVWSLALPADGLPLKKLSVIGSGKDLEALFGYVPKSGQGRRELHSCVDIEFGLTARNTGPEQAV